MHGFWHHDNTTVHTSLLVCNFLIKNLANTIPPAPYSPDITPCDFFLSPWLKLSLRGHRFGTICRCNKTKITTKVEGYTGSRLQKLLRELKKNIDISVLKWEGITF